MFHAKMVENFRQTGLILPILLAEISIFKLNMRENMVSFDPNLIVYFLLIDYLSI